MDKQVKDLGKKPWRPAKRNLTEKRTPDGESPAADFG
jgi:hypothetical protein